MGSGYKTFVDDTVLPAADVQGYLMDQAVIVCTSGTRPTPANGMLIYETDTKLHYTYYASAWRVFPQATPQTAKTSTLQTWAATSYTRGNTPCPKSFTAPISGRVHVTVTAEIKSSSSSELAYCAFEVRETDENGAVAEAADDDNAVVVQGTGYGQSSVRTLVTGLTPLATYYAQTMLRSSSASATATAFRRRIDIEMSGP